MSRVFSSNVDTGLQLRRKGEDMKLSLLISGMILYRYGTQES